MREPHIKLNGDADYVSFSMASRRALELYLAGRIERAPSAGEWYDADFRRRYAAILLRERGL